MKRILSYSLWIFLYLKCCEVWTFRGCLLCAWTVFRYPRFFWLPQLSKHSSSSRETNYILKMEVQRFYILILKFNGSNQPFLVHNWMPGSRNRLLQAKSRHQLWKLSSSLRILGQFFKMVFQLWTLKFQMLFLIPFDSIFFVIELITGFS